MTCFCRCCEKRKSEQLRALAESVTDEWLGARAAAEYIGVNPRTLYRWRMQDTRPRETPVPQIPWQVDANGRAKYRRADLDEYRRRNPNGPWRPGKR